jgi:hypothetical protein
MEIVGDEQAKMPGVAGKACKVGTSSVRGFSTAPENVAS